MTKEVKRIGIAIVFSMALFSVGNAQAAMNCSFKNVYADYKAANNASALEPLAKIGFPPALTALAKKANDPTLATVAGKLWDREGAELSKTLMVGLSQEQQMAALKKAQEWRHDLSGCKTAQKATPKAISKYSFAYGPQVVTLERRIPKKMAPNVLKAMFQALDNIATAPQGPVLLSLLEELEVRMTNRYNRYVGWQKRGNRNVLVVSASFMLDDSPQFVVQAIAQELVRKSYEMMPGKELADPYVRVIKGKKLVGSIYPDVKNKKFFRTVKRSLEMAESLPESLRKNLNAVDEIRYNPASKHFTKNGGIDGTVAYFNRTLSSEDNRLIFIRRKMLWSSPLDTLLSLTHEGNHALQHRTAMNYQRDIARGKGSDAKVNYLNTWNYRGPRNKAAAQFVKKFECEATMAEIAVARHYDASPATIEGSQYLKVCDDAQRQLIAWKNSKFDK